MRVNAQLSLPENDQPQKVGRPGSSNQQVQSAPVRVPQDQARLSVDSARIDQLKAKLSNAPEIRQGRVDALRQAIGQGSYQVSDQQLAVAMHSELVTVDGGTPGR
jgi:flagellar biosynthesis anti-sigma factor FlgM